MTADQQQFVKVPRAILVDAVVPANTRAFPSVLTIPQDADFEFFWLSLFRTNAALKALVSDSGTQRQMIYSGSLQQATAFDGILVDNWAGLIAENGGFPVAVPYIMPASRIYQHLFTDLSGSDNTVQLAYHGYALLPMNTAAAQ